MVVCFQQSLRILHDKDEQFGIVWSFGSVKRYLLPGASVGLARNSNQPGPSRTFQYASCSNISCIPGICYLSVHPVLFLFFKEWETGSRLKTLEKMCIYLKR